MGVKKMEKEKLANMIDHTILGSNIKKEAIIKKCKEVKDNGFASICTVPYYVSLAAGKLKQSESKICTVVGFPLGNTNIKSKLNETKKVLQDGAQEIDMVMNISAFKDNKYEYVEEEIKKIVNCAKDKDSSFIVKVIIETCYLKNDEIKKACEISKYAGADYVKTSTGFGDAGAKVEDVKLMKMVVGDDLKVKASGGISDYNKAVNMIEAGASRIGASSGVEIINSSINSSKN